MEILQLKYFLSAAKTENFSKTASLFSVPPSDISQCIKRLENELDIKLFIRSANSISLSEHGKKFYEKIKRAINLIDDAVLEIKDLSLSGLIKIAILTNRNTIMNKIEKYKKLYPDTNFEISHKIFENTNDFDIIIADDEFSNSNFLKKLILTEDIMLAIKKDNPIARKEKILTEDLKKEPFVCMNEGTSLYNTTQKIGEKLNFKPNIAIYSDDPFYIRKCVEYGLGVAFAPAKSWEGLFSENVVLKNVCDFKRNTNAYIPKNRYTKKCISSFLEILINE